MEEGSLELDSGSFSMEVGDFKVKRVKKFDRVWKVGVGGSLTSSPVLYGTTVYFGCADRFVYALDAASGRLRWKFETSGSIIEGSVCINDGVLYIGSLDRNMYALRTQDGTLVWKFTAEDSIASTPAIDEGVLYFGGKDRNVYALSADNGTLIWKRATSDGVISEATIAGERLLIGSYDHNLYCLDKRTGKVIWKFMTQGEIHNANRFAVKDGIVYFSSFDNFVRAVKIETGKLVWKHAIGQYGCCVAPVLHEGVLYCPARNGILYAISTDGRLLWKYVTTENVGIPRIHEGRIYLGSCDQSLHCMDMKGSRLWTFKTNGYVWWQPAVAGKNVIFGSWDCVLYAVDTQTREVSWKFRTAGSPSNIPPPFDAFEVEMVISEHEQEESRKRYDMNLDMRDEDETSTYKSRITYQVSTQYGAKGKYQVDSDEEAF